MLWASHNWAPVPAGAGKRYPPRRPPSAFIIQEMTLGTAFIIQEPGMITAFILQELGGRMLRSTRFRPISAASGPQNPAQDGSTIASS